MKQESKIEKEWDNIKRSLMESASEATGVQTKKQYNPWFDENRRKVILEKKKQD
jgi:hypothetical protein